MQDVLHPPLNCVSPGPALVRAGLGPHRGYHKITAPCWSAFYLLDLSLVLLYLFPGLVRVHLAEYLQKPFQMAPESGPAILRWLLCLQNKSTLLSARPTPGVLPGWATVPVSSGLELPSPRADLASQFCLCPSRLSSLLWPPPPRVQIPATLVSVPRTCMRAPST